MSDPRVSLTSSSKGNKMYLVKNGTQLLASCESWDMAYEFFTAYGGFAIRELHIEKETYNCLFCEIEYGLVTVGA